MARRPVTREDWRGFGVTASPVAAPAMVNTAGLAAGFAGELDRVLATRLAREERRAEREGQEAGRAAGAQDPAARMDADTVRGAAFNRGAIESGARRLETQVRTHLDELAREHPADPGALQARAAEYVAGVARGLPEDLRSPFQLAADTLIRPYVNEATRGQERAMADERIASFEQAQRPRLEAVTRNARNAWRDPAARAALAADMQAMEADLVAMGPRGAFTFRGREHAADPTRAGAVTLVQIERQIAGVEREIAEQTTLGSYEAGPRTREWIDGFERRARQGGIPGLDQDGIDRVVGQMRADAARRQHEADREQARRDREERARLAGINAEIRAADGMILSGYMPANIEALTASTRGTELAPVVDQLRAAGEEVQGFRLLPVESQVSILQDFSRRRDAGELDAAGYAQMQRYAAVYQAQQRAADADPLTAYAASTGAVIPPLDLANPDSLRARVAYAGEAAVHFGRRGAAPFTAAEAADLAGRFERAATPQEKLAVLMPFMDAPPAVREAAVTAFEKGRGDAGGLPAGSMALVLDAMRDPSRRPQAMALLGALLTEAPKVEGGQAGTLRTALDSAMEEGASGARREAMRVTGDFRPAALDERDRKLLDHLARQQMAAGASASQAVTNARAMLYGHLQAIDRDGLAHVYLPATVDAAAFERGLRVLRNETALVILDAAEPEREGLAARGDAVAIDRQRRHDRAALLARAGTWVNDGGGFALVAPETGEPVAMRGRVERVTVDEVLRAGSRASGADAELQRRLEARLRQAPTVTRPAGGRALPIVPEPMLGLPPLPENPFGPRRPGPFDPQPSAITNRPVGESLRRPNAREIMRTLRGEGEE